jgi:hypothetical protein
MTRYTILLKHNWKAPDWSNRKPKKQDAKSLGGQDLVDLELGTRTKLIPRLERQGEMDSFRFHTIRFYRTLSSLFIFAMAFILLYACTAHSSHSRLVYGGKDKLNQQRAPVSRKMTIDTNHDKDLSSLPYDEFINLVEEEMNQRKSGGKVKLAMNGSVDTLNSSSLSFQKDSSMDVSNAQDQVNTESDGKNMTFVQDSNEATMETATTPSFPLSPIQSQTIGMLSSQPHKEEVSKDKPIEKIRDPISSSFTPLIEPQELLLQSLQSPLRQDTLGYQDHSSFGLETNQFLAPQARLTIPDYLRSNLQYPLLQPLSSTFSLSSLDGSPGIERNPVLNSDQLYSLS